MSNISGFPECLPKAQIAFNRMVDIIKAEFELNGFIPLDTPAVERVSTLLSKGNDHEIYGIHRLAEGGKDKDLALRFDLTVPLARYVAQHYGQLTFPYRRYHIAPVWRGERPQAGRYRQFYQCDIDIVGDGELPLLYDAEVLSVIYRVFRAIGLERFIIKINNRFILTGLIKSFGMMEENITAIMRMIDKADKITIDSLVKELGALGLIDRQITLLTDLIAKRLSNREWLDYLPTLCDNPEYQQGLSELTQIMKATQDFGIPDEILQIDPTLARGLDYYTGTVSETKLLDYPELGSVCGGGRYADLAGSFSKKKLPGFGLSIGISRLIPKLIEAGIIKAEVETIAQVLVTCQNPECISDYIKIATMLRAHNICTEIYLATKSLAAQMKYADKKGFRFAIIADRSELDQQQIILRSLSDGEQNSMSVEDAIILIKQQDKAILGLTERKN